MSIQRSSVTRTVNRGSNLIKTNINTTEMGSRHSYAVLGDFLANHTGKNWINCRVFRDGISTGAYFHDYLTINPPPDTYLKTVEPTHSVWLNHNVFTCICT